MSSIISAAPKRPLAYSNNKLSSAKAEPFDDNLHLHGEEEERYETRAKQLEGGAANFPGTWRKLGSHSGKLWSYWLTG